MAWSHFIGNVHLVAYPVGVTTSSLRKIPEVTDVIIVSRPSQLPFELEEEDQEEASQ